MYKHKDDPDSFWERMQMTHGPEYKKPEYEAIPLGDTWPPVLYFGENWRVPMLDRAEQVPTPVGEKCLYCLEEIKEGDRGCMRVHVDIDRQTHVSPAHRECELRAVVGGVNHLKGTCKCGGGPDNPDPSGVSRREAAQLTWDWVQEHGI